MMISIFLETTSWALFIVSEARVIIHLVTLFMIFFFAFLYQTIVTPIKSN